MGCREFYNSCGPFLQRHMGVCVHCVMKMYAPYVLQEALLDGVKLEEGEEEELDENGVLISSRPVCATSPP